MASEIHLSKAAAFSLLVCQGFGGDFQKGAMVQAHSPLNLCSLRPVLLPDGHTVSYLYDSTWDRRPWASLACFFKPPFGRLCGGFSPSPVSALTPSSLSLLLISLCWLTSFKKTLQSECLGLPFFLSWCLTVFLWKLFF